MDCDDVIELNTLEEMVALINENPELDFIYSDEDKLTEDGTRRQMCIRDRCIIPLPCLLWYWESCMQPVRL